MPELVWAVGHCYETFDRHKVICISVQAPSEYAHYSRPIILMNISDGEVFRVMTNGSRYCSWSDGKDIVKMLPDEPDEGAITDAIIVQRRIDAIKGALKTDSGNPELEKDKRTLFRFFGGK